MVDLDWHIAARKLRKSNPKLWTLKRLAILFDRSETYMYYVVVDTTYQKEYNRKHRERILAQKRAYYHHTHKLVHAARCESKETGIPKDIILQNWGVK